MGPVASSSSTTPVVSLPTKSVAPLSKEMSRLKLNSEAMPNSWEVSMSRCQRLTSSSKSRLRLQKLKSRSAWRLTSRLRSRSKPQKLRSRSKSRHPKLKSKLKLRLKSKSKLNYNKQRFHSTINPDNSLITHGTASYRAELFCLYFI